MFSKDSIFYAYKRFPNLKDLMVLDHPYIIKPLKEADQDPDCSDCMKRCDSCKNFVDHISSLECFASGNISHAPHHIWYIYLAYCIKLGI